MEWIRPVLPLGVGVPVIEKYSLKEAILILQKFTKEYVYNVKVYNLKKSEDCEEKENKTIIIPPSPNPELIVEECKIIDRPSEYHYEHEEIENCDCGGCGNLKVCNKTNKTCSHNHTEIHNKTCGCQNKTTIIEYTCKLGKLEKMLKRINCIKQMKKMKAEYDKLSNDEKFVNEFFAPKYKESTYKKIEQANIYLRNFYNNHKGECRGHSHNMNELSNYIYNITVGQDNDNYNNDIPFYYKGSFINQGSANHTLNDDCNFINETNSKIEDECVKGLNNTKLNNITDMLERIVISLNQTDRKSVV